MEIFFFNPCLKNQVALPATLLSHCEEPCFCVFAKKQRRGCFSSVHCASRHAGLTVWAYWSADTQLWTNWHFSEGKKKLKKKNPQRPGSWLTPNQLQMRSFCEKLKLHVVRVHGVPTLVLVPVSDALRPPDSISLFPACTFLRPCFHQPLTLAAHYDEKHESAVLKIYCVCAKMLIILSNKLRREETEDRPSKAQRWKCSVSHSLSVRTPRPHSPAPSPGAFLPRPKSQQ